MLDLDEGTAWFYRGARVPPFAGMSPEGVVGPSGAPRPDGCPAGVNTPAGRCTGTSDEELAPCAFIELHAKVAVAFRRTRVERSEPDVADGRARGSPAAIAAPGLRSSIRRSCLTTDES